MLRTELPVWAGLERVAREPVPVEWEPEYEPEKLPPATREPRTERMMRMVIVVVRTAAMLNYNSGSTRRWRMGGTAVTW